MRPRSLQAHKLPSLATSLFSKMHGLGNDVVVLDLREVVDPTPAPCRALSDRHTGVGCDMILGIKEPRSPSAMAAFSIWTSQGLPSMQCGNGARCTGDPGVRHWGVRCGGHLHARWSHRRKSNSRTPGRRARHSMAGPVRLIFMTGPVAFVFEGTFFHASI